MWCLLVNFFSLSSWSNMHSLAHYLTTFCPSRSVNGGEIVVHSLLFHEANGGEIRSVALSCVVSFTVGV